MQNVHRNERNSTYQAWGKLDFEKNYIYALLLVQLISIFLDLLDGNV